MNPHVLPLVGATATVAVMVDLLRRRQLREKYAVLWLVVGVAVAAIAVFPRLLREVADLFGVKTPSNLLFFVAGLVLLVVCVQLSYEVSRLEDETRALAEEIAILGLEVHRRGPDPTDS